MCVEKQSQSGDIRVKIRQSGTESRKISKHYQNILPSWAAVSADYRTGLRCSALLVSAWLLVSCASTTQEPSLSSETREPAQQVQPQQAETERAEAEEARLAAERRERILQAEVERLAQEQAAAEQARLQAEREAEAARREAVARRERQQAVAAQAARVAEQEARIAQLEAEIASYDAMIAEQEQANARLEDAVLAAEDLLQALTAEQQKYDNVGANGEPLEPLDKDRLNELEAQASRLINAAQ